MLVEVSQLEALRGPIWFVDTRKRADYERGHIPGAIHFDNFEYANEATTPEGWRKALDDWRAMFAEAGIGPQGTFVFYDVGMENRAPRPAVMLRVLGNPDSYALHGGFYAWVQAGRPIDREPAAKPPIAVTDFSADVAAECIATVDEVHRALQGRHAAVLDVRDDEEYEGAKTQGNPRIGRIPWARHLRWTDFGEKATDIPEVVGRGKYPDHIVARYKSPEAIARMLAEVGIAPDDAVILYCQRSHRACAAYLALQRAGCRRVRIYAGSFREWSRRHDLPIEPPEHYLAERA